MKTFGQFSFDIGRHRHFVFRRPKIEKMNVAVDEAWHEKSPSRINLPAASNWRAADGPDSVARNSDIVQSLKDGRAVEDSGVVNYEVAGITVAGFHIRALSLMLCQPGFSFLTFHSTRFIN